MVKDTAKKMGAAVVGMMTVDNLIKTVKSELGQAAAKKLYGKVFNFGPWDEAIFDNAIGETSEDPVERKRIRLMVDQFLKDMKENDFSTEWLKAVLVKKNRDWKIDMKGKSPAAKFIIDIDKGDDFEEKVKMANSELMHKTVKSRVRDGWQVLVGESGKLKLFVNPEKIQVNLSQATEDFKSGVRSQFWPVVITFIVLGLLSMFLIHY